MEGLLFAATLKSTLCLALAGLVALGLWRRSAAQRHLVWAAAIVAALLLPPLQLALPEWRLPVGAGGPWLVVLSGEQPVAPGSDRASGEPRVVARGPAAAPTPAAAGAAVRSQGLAPATKTDGAHAPEASAQHAGRARDVRSGLLLLWSLGAALTLAPLAVASLRIARIARRARPLDTPRWAGLAERVAEAQHLDRGRLDLRRAGGPITPLTWGVLRPVVILPESCEAWTDAQAYEVLLHEAGHVRRHDCLTQLLASAACVLYWFNPLVWLAGRQMLTERERACDDQVLLAGARASDYANDLLDLARRFGAPWSTSHVTTAMARRSQIAGRLLAVLDPHLDRRTVGRRPILAGAVLTLALLLPLASATLVAGAAGANDVAALETAASTAGATDLSRPASAPPEVGERRERAPRPLDLAAAAREIGLRERAYAAALARRDLDALADFYTEDAQLAAPSFPVAYGRRSVRGLLQRIVDAGITKVQVEAGELFPVGDLACQAGSERFSDGSTVSESRFLKLWRNEDGTWRIHRDWATR
jgi:beta-lactamase regulating signal transducer with metallopeptidase domain/ketosteroid isomerase-like protein